MVKKMKQEIEPGTLVMNERSIQSKWMGEPAAGGRKPRVDIPAEGV